MVDEKTLNRRVCSINGCVMEWHLGKTKILKTPMEKIHCSDYFVYEATNNSEGNICGAIKASLRVAEKLSWYIAEREALKQGQTDEAEIERIRDRILFEKFGISVGLFAKHGWLTTKQKVTGRMEQALRREGYLKGEWKGVELEKRFEIFVNYEDFAGTSYNPYVMFYGVLAGSHQLTDTKWIKNIQTKRWEKVKIVEDYGRYNGETYFVSIPTSNGEIRHPQSLEEAMSRDRGALHLKSAGLCSFDVNYTTATPEVI